MEFSKPIHEVEHELAKEVRRIVKETIRPEQSARMFAELEKTHPDIHELINRLQRATGNDRYYCMMDCLDQLKVQHPYGFYREPTKTDSPDYVFDNGNVVRRGRGR